MKYLLKPQTGEFGSKKPIGTHQQFNVDGRQVNGEAWWSSLISFNFASSGGQGHELVLDVWQAWSSGLGWVYKLISKFLQLWGLWLSLSDIGKHGVSFLAQCCQSSARENWNCNFATSVTEPQKPRPDTAIQSQLMLLTASVLGKHDHKWQVESLYQRHERKETQANVGHWCKECSARISWWLFHSACEQIIFLWARLRQE